MRTSRVSIVRLLEGQHRLTAATAGSATPQEKARCTAEEEDHETSAPSCTASHPPDSIARSCASAVDLLVDP